MAEVQQPQLVHKQFNSPIGLYSEQNIKDTINRELKAVGGVGIELHDKKPYIPEVSSSHLANSYVLKMLQEEENEKYLVRYRKQQQQRSRYSKSNQLPRNGNNNNQNQFKNKNKMSHTATKSGGNNVEIMTPRVKQAPILNVSANTERQSRARQRVEYTKNTLKVDRDTVLKINRLHPNYYRDISWPPPSAFDASSRSHSEDNCFYFDESVRKKHSIDKIKNLFEHGTIYESKKDPLKPYTNDHSNHFTKVSSEMLAIMNSYNNNINNKNKSNNDSYDYDSKLTRNDLINNSFCSANIGDNWWLRSRSLSDNFRLNNTANTQSERSRIPTAATELESSEYPSDPSIIIYSSLKTFKPQSNYENVTVVQPLNTSSSIESLGSTSKDSTIELNARNLMTSKNMHFDTPLIQCSEAQTTGEHISVRKGSEMQQLQLHHEREQEQQKIVKENPSNSSLFIRESISNSNSNLHNNLSSLPQSITVSASAVQPTSLIALNSESQQKAATKAATKKFEMISKETQYEIQSFNDDGDNDDVPIEKVIQSINIEQGNNNSSSNKRQQNIKNSCKEYTNNKSENAKNFCERNSSSVTATTHFPSPSSASLLDRQKSISCIDLPPVKPRRDTFTSAKLPINQEDCDPHNKIEQPSSETKLFSCNATNMMMNSTVTTPIKDTTLYSKNCMQTPEELQSNLEEFGTKDELMLVERKSSCQMRNKCIRNVDTKTMFFNENWNRADLNVTKSESEASATRQSKMPENALAIAADISATEVPMIHIPQQPGSLRSSASAQPDDELTLPKPPIEILYNLPQQDANAAFNEQNVKASSIASQMMDANYLDRNTPTASFDDPHDDAKKCMNTLCNNGQTDHKKHHYDCRSSDLAQSISDNRNRPIKFLKLPSDFLPEHFRESSDLMDTVREGRASSFPKEIKTITPLPQPREIYLSPHQFYNKQCSSEQFESKFDENFGSTLVLSTSSELSTSLPSLGPMKCPFGPECCPQQNTNNINLASTTAAAAVLTTATTTPIPFPRSSSTLSLTGDPLSVNESLCSRMNRTVVDDQIQKNKMNLVEWTAEPEQNVGHRKMLVFQPNTTDCSCVSPLNKSASNAVTEQFAKRSNNIINKITATKSRQPHAVTLTSATLSGHVDDKSDYSVCPIIVSKQSNASECNQISNSMILSNRSLSNGTPTITTSTRIETSIESNDRNLVISNSNSLIGLHPNENLLYSSSSSSSSAPALSSSSKLITTEPRVVDASALNFCSSESALVDSATQINENLNETIKPIGQVKDLNLWSTALQSKFDAQSKGLFRFDTIELKDQIHYDDFDEVRATKSVTPSSTYSPQLGSTVMINTKESIKADNSYSTRIQHKNEFFDEISTTYSSPSPKLPSDNERKNLLQQIREKVNKTSQKADANQQPTAAELQKSSSAKCDADVLTQTHEAFSLISTQNANDKFTTREIKQITYTDGEYIYVPTVIPQDQTEIDEHINAICERPTVMNSKGKTNFLKNDTFDNDVATETTEMPNHTAASWERTHISATSEAKPLNDEFADILKESDNRDIKNINTTNRLNYASEADEKYAIIETSIAEDLRRINELLNTSSSSSFDPSSSFHSSLLASSTKFRSYEENKLNNDIVSATASSTAELSGPPPPPGRCKIGIPNSDTILILETPLALIKQMFATTNSALIARSISPALIAASFDYKCNNNKMKNITMTTTVSENANKNFLENLKQIYEAPSCTTFVNNNAPPAQPITSRNNQNTNQIYSLPSSRTKESYCVSHLAYPIEDDNLNRFRRGYDDSNNNNNSKYNNIISNKEEKEYNIIKELPNNIDINSINEQQEVSKTSLPSFNDNLVDNKATTQQQSHRESVTNSQDCYTSTIPSLSFTTSAFGLMATESNFGQSNQPTNCVITNHMGIQLENMPIVERVLSDLYNISRTLESNNVTTSNDANSNDDINYNISIGRKNKSEDIRSDYCIIEDTNKLEQSNPCFINEAQIKTASSINISKDKMDNTKSDWINESSSESHSMPCTTSVIDDLITKSRLATSNTTLYNGSKKLKQNTQSDNINNDQIDSKVAKAINRCAQILYAISSDANDSSDDYDLFKIMANKNILSDYLITKQNQEELLQKAQATIEKSNEDTKHQKREIRLNNYHSNVVDNSDDTKTSAQRKDCNVAITSQKMEKHQQISENEMNQHDLIKQYESQQQQQHQPNQHFQPRPNLLKSTDSSKLTLSNYNLENNDYNEAVIASEASSTSPATSAGMLAANYENNNIQTNDNYNVNNKIFYKATVSLSNNEKQLASSQHHRQRWQLPATECDGVIMENYDKTDTSIASTTAITNNTSTKTEDSTITDSKHQYKMHHESVATALTNDKKMNNKMLYLNQLSQQQNVKSNEINFQNIDIDEASESTESKTITNSKTNIESTTLDNKMMNLCASNLLEDKCQKNLQLTSYLSIDTDAEQLHAASEHPFPSPTTSIYDNIVGEVKQQANKFYNVIRPSDSTAASVDIASTTTAHNTNFRAAVMAGNNLAKEIIKINNTNKNANDYATQISTNEYVNKEESVEHQHFNSLHHMQQQHLKQVQQEIISSSINVIKSKQDEQFTNIRESASTSQQHHETKIKFSKLDLQQRLQQQQQQDNTNDKYTAINVKSTHDDGRNINDDDDNVVVKQQNDSNFNINNKSSVADINDHSIQYNRVDMSFNENRNDNANAITNNQNHNDQCKTQHPNDVQCLISSETETTKKINKYDKETKMHPQQQQQQQNQQNNKALLESNANRDFNANNMSATTATKLPVAQPNTNALRQQANIHDDIGTNVIISDQNIASTQLKSENLKSSEQQNYISQRNQFSEQQKQKTYPSEDHKQFGLHVDSQAQTNAEETHQNLHSNTFDDFLTNQITNSEASTQTGHLSEQSEHTKFEAAEQTQKVSSSLKIAEKQHVSLKESSAQRSAERNESHFKSNQISKENRSEARSKQFISKKFFKIRSTSQPPPLEYLKLHNSFDAATECIEHFNKYIDNNRVNNHSYKSCNVNASTPAPTPCSNLSEANHSPIIGLQSITIEKPRITKQKSIVRQQKLDDNANESLSVETGPSEKTEKEPKLRSIINEKDQRTNIALDDLKTAPDYDFYSSDPSIFSKDEEERKWIDNEGYKRVAWPPTCERKIIREFTPQPQSDPNQGVYNNTTPTNPTQQYQQQQHQNRFLSPAPQSQPNPNQGHPNQGHPNQGHPNQGHPNQGHPNQGHPNQPQHNQSHPNQPQHNQSHPNQPQHNQTHPGQQYFPPQQAKHLQQQPAQSTQPKSQPQNQYPHPQQQYPFAENQHPAHLPAQQNHQPNPMNQPGSTVSFAGGIPVKSIPGLSPAEPPQQYEPNGWSKPQSQTQHQQPQGLYQAQHQPRYEAPEPTPAPHYQQQQKYQPQIPPQYHSEGPQQQAPSSFGGWSHVTPPKPSPMYAPSHQQQHQQQPNVQPSYQFNSGSPYGQSQTYQSMPNSNGQDSSAMPSYGHNGQPQYHHQPSLANKHPSDQDCYPNQQQYNNQPSHYPNQPQNQYPYQPPSAQHAVDQHNIHPQYNNQQQQQQPNQQSDFNTNSYSPQQQYNLQGGQPQQQYEQQPPQEQPHSGIVTLRKDPPYTQKPAPTVVSQPAARSLRGGSVMRGDLKWPPPDTRERMEAEAELQRQLSLGPAQRPVRMPKDYSGFFAKHALSHYYPGYKIPPGTQHMIAEY